jgi:hypothetical protein
MLINFSMNRKGTEEMVEPEVNPSPPTAVRRKSVLPSVGAFFSFFSGKKEEPEEQHNTTIDVIPSNKSIVANSFRTQKVQREEFWG